MMPINLVLVRHGSSEGNVANRKSRRGDNSSFTDDFKCRLSANWRLTLEGVEQAQKTGQWLKDHLSHITFDRAYTSSYTRAMETAGHLGLDSVLWFQSHELRERDWGDLDVMPDDVRKMKFADALSRREAGMFLWRPPGGEKLAEVQTRIRDWLGSLHRECGDKNVIAVLHAETMAVIRVVLERKSLHDFHDMWNDPNSDIGNCSVLHYTRRDPSTGELSRYLEWVRLVSPNQNGGCFDWQKVVRRRYTSAELIALAERYPRIIA